MADELSELNFDQDLEEVLSLDEARRWNLQKLGALDVLATMSPASKPDEVFFPRFRWNSYPGDPPSLKFRSREGDSYSDPTAWPEMPGFRPTSLDACVTWTAEGFALHPEWRNDPNYRWTINGNVLLKVLRTLQNTFDRNFVKRYHP